jgi:hypothetical protein
VISCCTTIIWIDLVWFIQYYSDVIDIQLLAYWSSFLWSYRKAMWYIAIENFILHTNWHTQAFLALRASLPIFGSESILLERYLFYNRVFFHLLYKSDIYQVSLNVDKNVSARALLLQVISITWHYYGLLDLQCNHRLFSGK